MSTPEQRLRAKHTRVEFSERVPAWCSECQTEWPCDVIAALDAKASEGARITAEEGDAWQRAWDAIDQREWGTRYAQRNERGTWETLAKHMHIQGWRDHRKWALGQAPEGQG